MVKGYGTYCIIGLETDSKLHNYDITHCSFCGAKIKEQTDPSNEYSSTKL
ncbi:MAG: hypothetical protein L0H53_12825 [Candidatus Nitrosocosmicus sp.]|nr:hypothetical protein [Candidatus Nitrosocosmicus sp.]